MWDLAWLVFDFIFSVGLDALLDALSDLPETRKSVSARSSVELIAAAVAGTVIGVLSGWVAPERVLPPGPFQGVSLIIVPVFLGLAMELWGRFRRKHGGSASTLATWYGGATLGLCLALGRFINLG